MSTVTLILTIIVLVFVGGGWYLYTRIRTSIRQFSQTAFGVDSLAKGLVLQETHLENTPKSVSAMTKLFLPQIQQDFPGFSLPEYIQKGENVLKSILAAVEAQDDKMLEGLSLDLKTQVSLKIQDQIKQEVREHFQDVQIYQTEVSNYHKLNGCCIIQLESSVSYKYWKSSVHGEGNEGKKTQTIYQLELMYIQDIDLLPQGGTAIGLTCPHCGAPVKTIGEKYCDYCHSAIEPINVRVWQFTKIFNI